MNPLCELISELRASWTRKRESEHRKRRERSRNRRLMIEPLEGRRLLAIVWANEFGVNDFDIYGNDEVYARDMVNRAMDDWDRVITDFNYDGDTNPNTTNSLNDTYTLTINAATLASPTTRAQTAIPNFDPNGLPTDTTITMDNDTAGFSTQRRSMMLNLPVSLTHSRLVSLIPPPKGNLTVMISIVRSRTKSATLSEFL